MKNFLNYLVSYLSFNKPSIYHEQVKTDGLSKALVEAADRAGIGITLLQNVGDKKAAIVMINTSACKISGYSEKEALSMTIRDVIPLDILGKIMKNYVDRQSGKDVDYTYEAAIIRKDKVRIPILISLTTTLFRGKISTVVYFRDISGIKKDKEELLSERNKLETILMSIGEGLFVVDLKGKLILVNKAFENMLGWSKEEALGKIFVDLVPAQNEEGELINPNKRPVYRAMAEKRDISMSLTEPNYYLVRKDKRRFPIEYKVTLLKFDGKLMGAVGIFHDVTKEKEIDKAKTEFVSMASHELRSPLSVMKAFIMMIFNGDFGPINEKLQSPLKEIKKSTENLIKLADDILDVSRIEAGKMPLKFVGFKTEELIKEVVSNYGNIAKSDVKVKIGNISTDEVLADKNRVREVLINLLDNALKFTKKGEIEVSSISTDGFINIFVRDTGIGISESDQKNLFNKFHQAKNEKFGTPSGTGLGLYISKSLAKKMGGDLWLESSKQNKGSIFVFSLPKKKTK